ncbi:MAG: acyltransferase [Steroidobacteraceae bacterium]|jgi:maltose O-acetyltransferase|nr:acyltransferase [Steroidobacteraceae bacterium]
MQTLKRLFWDARAELKSLLLWICGAAPGGAGVRLRRLVYRRYLQRLGANTVFQSGLRIASPERVSIGANCNFAQGVFITGGGGVRIGDWVGFGPDAKVWSVNHRFEDPDRPWLLQGWEAKPVIIEDDVWLGASVFVMPGVTIGKGAIISAAAVVNKSIPPYAIVSGNPGRVIGWRKTPHSLVRPESPVAPASLRDERPDESGAQAAEG